METGLSHLAKDLMDYVHTREELKPLLGSSAILLTGSSTFRAPDNVTDRDLLILVEDSVFRRFEEQYGSSYVIDDRSREPPIWARIRSSSWMDEEVAADPIVAFWIYKHAELLQDVGNACRQRLNSMAAKFSARRETYLWQTYVRFRYQCQSCLKAIARRDELSMKLLSAEAVTAALELVLLLNRKPYPYQKWLAWSAEHETPQGRDLIPCCSACLSATTPPELDVRLRSLRSLVLTLLEGEGCFPRKRLDHWWLYLP